MPILLTTPHTYDPGHGQASVNYALVLIETMAMHSSARQLKLALMYCNVSPTTGALEPSPERQHTVIIENIEAVVDHNQRVNDEGEPEVIETVRVAADPAFDNMRAAFKVRVNAGALEVDGISADLGSEAQGYDIVSAFLYEYLIDHGYYEGTIL